MNEKLDAVDKADKNAYVHWKSMGDTIMIQGVQVLSAESEQRFFDLVGDEIAIEYEHVMPDFLENFTRFTDVLMEDFDKNKKELCDDLADMWPMY